MLSAASIDPFQGRYDMRVVLQSRCRVGAGMGVVRLRGSQTGESVAGVIVSAAERGVEQLLHLRPRTDRRLLMPCGDRAYRDPEMRGKSLVAQSQRRLKGRSASASPVASGIHTTS